MFPRPSSSSARESLERIPGSSQVTGSTSAARPPKPTSKATNVRRVESAVPRPAAPANANYPPQERQRVRRACEGCRIKKVKCDGAETCQRCINHAVECIYADFVPPPKSFDSTHVEKLESRVASMEQLFRQFLDQFTSGSITINGPAAVATNRRADESVVQDDSIVQNGPDEPADEDGGNYQLDDQEIVEEIPRPEEKQDEESSDEDEAPSKGYVYADGFGELDPDTNGELRYVGLGSTASVVDTCVGLRRHIYKGLERKGYEGGDTFFASPEAVTPDSNSYILRHALQRDMPPPAIVYLFIDTYIRELSFLFPIISEEDVRSLYQDKIMNDEAMDDRHSSVFLSILAVAAPLVPVDHHIFQSYPKYNSVNMGATFYGLAMEFTNLSLSGKSERKGGSQDIVLALGLQSMYLAEIGSQAEAWIVIGRAVRLGQDLGLHRSPERLNLPSAERSKRRYIWWCLYMLERQLSIALGRPLCIDDTDCDVEIPTEETDGKKADETSGFIALIHLHKILGVILKTVSSVKNADLWREVRQYNELRVRVQESNLALQNWAKDQVPQHIKTAKTGTHLAEKQIALSCFFSAIILLHRVFMANPHRPSPLEDSQAQLRCAKAATDCIRGTAEFFRSVPKSHYLVFHGQYVFVSAIVLLQCIRGSNDTSYIENTLNDVKMALDGLRCLEASWKGAKKCRDIVEEYLEFTLDVLEGGRKGQCHFEHCDDDHGISTTRKSRFGNKATSQTRQLSQSTNNNGSPSKKRKHLSSHLSSQIHGITMNAESCSHPSGRHSAGPVAPNSGHLRTPDPLDSSQPSKRPRTLQRSTLVEEIAEMPVDTHFDNLIGDVMSIMPVNPPMQRDIFFPGSFDLDFNSAELSLLYPELWTVDDRGGHF